jgi:hypothetical protein
MLSQDSVGHERRMADIGEQSEGRCAVLYVVCFGGAELGCRACEGEGEGSEPSSV